MQKVVNRGRVCPGLAVSDPGSFLLATPSRGVFCLFMVRQSHSPVLKLALNSCPPFPCFSQVLGFQSWPVHRLLSNSFRSGTRIHL